MLVSRTESLLRRMNWKVLAFDGKLGQTHKETYGFRSPNMPPPAVDLQSFTDDLWDMVRNVQFRNVNSEFQKTLKSDHEKHQRL